MGSPKKPKKKYKKPLVIWQSDLIAEQKILLREYGLKNKKEIWKAEGFLKKTRDQAKHLIAEKSEQAEKEKEQLITKLVNLGLVPPASKLEDVLSLTVKDILDRRLQTIICKNSLVKTPRQARQFIVHGHIAIKDQKINVPSYLVPMDLESKITFNPASKLSNDQHPERAKEKSRKEQKVKREGIDETDIFAGDKSEKEVKKEVTKKIEEKKEKPLKAAPKEQIPKDAPKKEPIQKVDEVTPTENKTKETENIAEGKPN